MRGYIATEVVSVDSLDVGSWSKNGHPKRGALVGQGMEMVKYHLLYLLLHLLVGTEMG